MREEGKAAACRHGRESQVEMPFQEVLTLHVRAPSGERRVQALGEVIRTPVCAACLEEYIALETDEKRLVRRLRQRHGLIGLAGALLVAATRLPSMGRVTLLPGVFALGFGLLGYIKAAKEGKERLKRLGAMDQAEREQALLPGFIRRRLPEKEGENDLSYVPFERGLAALSTAELMRRYGLLKDIAEQLKNKALAAPERE